MAAFQLTFVLLATLGMRLQFIAFHFSNPSSLWSDYERRGVNYRIAQVLDVLTLICFAVPILISLYKIRELHKPLLITFIGFLGIQLLSRLRVHRFPRMNVAGALSEAKVDLVVHLAMSIAGAVCTTLLVAVYLWWRS